MTFPRVVETCLAEIKKAKASLIYLLGADDAGKTTLTEELANRLILQNKKVAIIDADSGQSNRLPLTLSLNYANRQFDKFSELALIDWGFMPGYDLTRCFELYIELVGRWVKRAKGETDCCFVDSNGDVRKWLKLRELEVFSPDLVIALQRKSELEAILKSLRRGRILRLPVPEEAKRKSWELRRRIRNERFRLYFENSSVQIVKCEVPFDFRHRIVGLYGQGRFLGLGVAEDKSADGLRVVTPVRSKPDKVEFSLVKFEAFCTIGKPDVTMLKHGA